MRLKKAWLVYFFLLVFVVFLIYQSSCKLKTHYLSFQTKNIDEKIYSKGCWEENLTREEYLDMGCLNLTREHNRLIDEWNSLPCVNNNLSQWD